MWSDEIIDRYGNGANLPLGLELYVVLDAGGTPLGMWDSETGAIGQLMIGRLKRALIH